MMDILERLQGPRTPQGGLWPYPNLHDEAAEEITRLREENAGLRDALEEALPFVRIRGMWSEEIHDRIAASIREGGKDA